MMPQELHSSLREKLAGALKITILGVGSKMRGDDGAGISVAEAFLENRLKSDRIQVILGQTTPENFTGTIRAFGPSHVIIVDSVDFESPKATASLIDLSAEKDSSFSTHRLPLKMLEQFLKDTMGCKVVMIGIQPKSIKMSEAMSSEVKSAVVATVAAIEEVLRDVLSINKQKAGDREQEA